MSNEQTSKRIQAALDVLNQTLFGRAPKRRRRTRPRPPAPPVDDAASAARWESRAIELEAEGKPAHAALARRAAAQHRAGPN